MSDSKKLDEIMKQLFLPRIIHDLYKDTPQLTPEEWADDMNAKIDVLREFMDDENTSD